MSTLQNKEQFALETAPYPYPGLRSFSRDEYGVFFGRGAHVRAIQRKLLENRFLAVVGSSGCGKSSLVRAGLIPKLQFMFQDQFEFAIARPGKEPLRNLAEAICNAISHSDDVDYFHALLRQDSNAIENYLSSKGMRHKKFLLVIDQFEEIFRYKSDDEGEQLDESEVRKFVKRVLHPVKRHRAKNESSVHVMLTMRSDFLGSCAEFEGLAEEISESQFLTPRMNREQLQQAIIGPSRVFGFEFQPVVLNRILNEIGNDPDQLPVMQHLLMRLWQKARRNVEGEFTSVFEKNKARSQGVEINTDHYEAVGGVNDALKNHGRIVLESHLDEKERKIAEQILKAITTIDSEGRAVRNPQTLKEILRNVKSRLESPKYLQSTSRTEICNVLNELRKEGRTFVFPHINDVGEDELDDEIPVDITHEGLIRKWDKLTEWTIEEQDRKKIESEINRKAAIWKNKNRHLSHLLSGVELEAARSWMEEEFGLNQRDFSQKGVLERRKNDFEKVPEAIQDFLFESERSGELFTTSEKLSNTISLGKRVLFGLAALATLVIIGVSWHAKSEVEKATSAQKEAIGSIEAAKASNCLLYTSPSPRDKRQSRMPSSA